MSNGRKEVEPLRRFKDLRFLGDIYYTNENHEPRARDPSQSLCMTVVGETDETYRLGERFQPAESHLHTYALSPNENIEFNLICPLGDARIIFCVSHTLLASHIAEILPFGERTTVREWHLELLVELDHESDTDTTYPLRLVIQRSHQKSFFIRRVTLELPKKTCDEWLQYALNAYRQRYGGLDLL